MLQTMTTLLLLLLPFMATSNDGGTTMLAVPFKYKIQVHREQGLLTTAIDQLENFTINTFHTVAGGHAPVDIDMIDSEPLESCRTTLTDDFDCFIVESTITLVVDAGIDEHIVERATLAEVQGFLLEFNVFHTNRIQVDYMGPFPVNVDTRVRLEGLNKNRIMNLLEITLFEEAMLRLLNSVLVDEAEITKVVVFLQHLEEATIHRSLRTSTTNTVYIRIDGTCHACGSNSFGILTNDAIDGSSDYIERELQDAIIEDSQNEDDGYFDDISLMLISPDVSTPNAAQSKPNPEPIMMFPYWVLMGLAGGVFVIMGGFIYTARAARNNRLHEIEMNRKAHMQDMQRIMAQSEEEEYLYENEGELEMIDGEEGVFVGVTLT